MKHLKKNTAKNLDRLLAMHAHPSSEKTDVAIDRLWKREGSRIGDALAENAASLVPVRPLRWTFPKVALVTALAVALLVAVLPVFRGLRKSGAPALIEIVGSGLQRITGEGAQPILAGAPLAFGEVIRSNVGAGAVFALRDGSRIEMRPNSELALETASDGIRIRLNAGSVLVTAAKQRDGHLYVQTRDVIVSVVGTVFLVNAEEAGSRVAVLQGEVRVQQGATVRTLLPGDQVASNPLMEPRPVREEISWSPHAAAHLALLQEQSRANPNVRTPPLFDLDSVDPAPTQTAAPATPACRDINGRLPQQLRWPCLGQSVTLTTLIGEAYGVASPRINGLPQWASEGGNGFRVQATADLSTVLPKEQLQQMLQSVLEDRFKLKVHRETGEVQGYVLTVGKGGLQLQQASGEEALTVTNKLTGVSRQITITGKASMKTFADFLSGSPGVLVGRVLDRTALTGAYAVDLTYTVMPMGWTGRDPTPAASTLASALEQRGLRLDPAKIPDDVIVVDQVEKLTKDFDKRMAFEVVSIRTRPTQAGGGAIAGAGGQRGGLGGDTRPCGSIVQISPGRFVVNNVSLYRLIALAYGKSCRASTDAKLISGGPLWIQSDRFDIQATMPEGSPRYTMQALTDGQAPELQMMLQAMLKDRFNLALHEDLREGPVYNLIVIKAGVIKASEDQTPPVQQTSAVRGQPVGVDPAKPQPRSLSVRIDSSTGKVTVSASAIPLSLFIDLFQGLDGRFVVDRTGLKGLIDIPSQSMDSSPFAVGLTLVWPEILQKLGLKLEAARAPIEVLTIDGVEKPSEN